MPRRLSGLLFLCSMATSACLLAAAPVEAAEKAPVRVGVIGLDNYHSVAFAQLFNNPKAEGDLAGVKIVAAYPGGSPDIAESADNLPKWKEQIKPYGVKQVATIAELLGQVDAVMITSLDGRVHWQQAKPVIDAGKPLFIDRPMAASLDDVLRIFQYAAKKKVKVFSSSQHRYSPGFIGMRDHEEVGKVLGCFVYGGCPREPHHPELYWHAVHGVETLYTIMRPGCVSVTRVSNEDYDVVTGTWGDGRVGVYRGNRKGAIRYSALVFGDKGIAPAGVYGYSAPVKGVLPKNDRYMGYESIALQIGKFFKTGVLPVQPDETIEVFAFLEAAEESKRQNGIPVKLATVIEKAKARIAK